MPHVTQLLLVLTVGSSFWQQTAAVTAHLGRSHVGAPGDGSLAGAYVHSVKDWQPMAENNWIILQTTASSAPISLAASYAAHAAHKRSHSHLLPLHYYAHNHSGGNYQAPAKDVRLVESSHVAHANSGSKRRTKEHTAAAGISPLPPRFIYGHKVRSPSAADAISSAAVMSATSIAVERRRLIRQQGAAGDNADGGNIYWDNAKEVTEQQEQREPELNAADKEDDIGKQDYNEIVAPLQSALAKMKSICDTVEHIISDEDDGAAADDGNEAAEGRFSSVHISTHPQPTTSAPLSVGSGRKVKKLKKKFQKLLLPLLLAYKLKFLTLIPVLIGGLTLLVGATGMAGFFFALFTAVMSLKATGGSKSIVVKSG